MYIYIYIYVYVCIHTYIYNVIKEKITTQPLRYKTCMEFDSPVRAGERLGSTSHICLIADAPQKVNERLVLHRFLRHRMTLNL